MNCLKNAKASVENVGLEGGFSSGEPKFEYDEQWSIVILPDFVSIPLPNASLPAKVCLNLYEKVPLCIFQTSINDKPFTEICRLDIVSNFLKASSSLIRLIV